MKNNSSDWLNCDKGAMVGMCTKGLEEINGNTVIYNSNIFNDVSNSFSITPTENVDRCIDKAQGLQCNTSVNTSGAVNVVEVEEGFANCPDGEVVVSRKSSNNSIECKKITTE